jgi:hypothetical protein
VVKCTIIKRGLFFPRNFFTNGDICTLINIVHCYSLKKMQMNIDQCSEPNINIASKNLRKSTQRLETEIISDNKPLRGGNLLLPHLNVQVQDDSK